MIPREFYDPQVFDDPKVISNGSIDFENPKVYGDTNIPFHSISISMSVLAIIVFYNSVG